MSYDIILILGLSSNCLTPRRLGTPQFSTLSSHLYKNLNLLDFLAELSDRQSIGRVYGWRSLCDFLARSVPATSHRLHSIVHTNNFSILITSSPSSSFSPFKLLLAEIQFTVKLILVMSQY